MLLIRSVEKLTHRLLEACDLFQAVIPRVVDPRFVAHSDSIEFGVRLPFPFHAI